MAKMKQKITLNQWFLLVLSTVAFAVSGFRQLQQQAWFSFAAVLVAWFCVLLLILRHRRSATSVLGAELKPLEERIRMTSTELHLDDEIWPLEAVSAIEMAVIDQKRAYVYFTLRPSTDADTETVVRQFLFPFSDFDRIQQKLNEAFPTVKWLLP